MNNIAVYRGLAVWSDKESEYDYLNFGEVSQLAVDVLTFEAMLPVSIGVFGNWGAGKSSLLKLIEQKLASDSKRWVVIKFDAWLYQGFDDSRAALLESIATALGNASEGNEGLLSKTRQLLSRVNAFRALGLLAEGAAFAAGIPTGGLISRGVGVLQSWTDGSPTKDDFDSLSKTAKDAKEEISGLLKPSENKSPPQQIEAFRREYCDILENLNRPVAVVIDNLDRCMPANAIHTLEAIRLFLFLTNTAFIIAADEEMIRSSVAEYFKGASERHQIDYLDKLIQVPIRVPKAGVREVRAYLFMLYAANHGLAKVKLDALRDGLERSLQESWCADPISREDAVALTGEPDEGSLAQAFERADRIAPVLANSPNINGNPRIVKRLLNVVKMRSQVARRRSMPLDEAIITKLVIFERCVGAQATADFYRIIDAERGRPSLLVQLEDAEDEFPEGAPSSWSDKPTTKLFICEWARLEPKLSGVDLRAAIYLSRETMPIGATIAGLSPIGREALKVLVETKNESSPTVDAVLKTLPQEEHVPVMEGMIAHLRQVSDWSRRPVGFAGGVLLARCSPDAAKILRRFLNDPTIGEKQPPWMAAMLKHDHWYKGI